MNKHAARQASSQPSCKVQRFLPGPAGQQQDELVTAESAYDVALARISFEYFRELFQHCIAREMPIAIIDRLEVVDIAHHQTGWSAVLQRRNTSGEQTPEPTAVVQLREIVHRIVAQPCKSDLLKYSNDQQEGQQYKYQHFASQRQRCKNPEQQGVFTFDG